MGGKRESFEMTIEYENLIGQKFGRWNPVEYVSKGKWKCYCDCNPDIFYIRRADDLKRGISTSCGCIRREGDLRDLTGERFGKLLVIKRIENDKRRCSQWICRCDCDGNEDIVTGKQIGRAHV